MRLHLPAIPHTQTREAFSHCAFTGKVLKFVPMMRAQGYEVVHYGVGDENPGATEHVSLMSVDEQSRLLGYVAGADHRAFVGNDANVGHPLYQHFNQRLRQELAGRATADDVVCLPFGHAHQAGVEGTPARLLESGVGYPVCFTTFRVYESNAWYAFHAGKDGTGGHDYQWVIPNYFVVNDWKLGTGPRRYLAYFGRIVPIKGVNVVAAIAKARPDLDVILCGQGDPTPWLSKDIPNLTYREPLTGTARSDFLGGAIALLAPSYYIEPFCGVTVEANLCGTPALTSDHGAFPETVENGNNGWRCHVLRDWLAGIRWTEQITHHAAIRTEAVGKYGLDAIGPRYRAVLNQLADLNGKGWYAD